MYTIFYTSNFENLIYVYTVIYVYVDICVYVDIYTLLYNISSRYM